METVKTKTQIRKVRILMANRLFQSINLDQFRLKMRIHLSKWVITQVTTTIQMNKMRSI